MGNQERRNHTYNDPSFGLEEPLPADAADAAAIAITHVIGVPAIKIHEQSRTR